MRPICIKGKKISNFLIQTSFKTYPMLDTKYLETVPLHKEIYATIIEQNNNHYKLLKYVFV